MDSKLIALKLVLDELDEEDKISSVKDRVRIQKAIYLTQLLGVNLGYGYSWYIKGPYSTSLTQDYYQLDEEKRSGDFESANVALNEAVKNKLQDVKAVLEKPDEIELDISGWYELLASIHFLVRRNGKPLDAAKSYLKTVKPHLHNYFDIGAAHLQKCALL